MRERFGGVDERFHRVVANLDGPVSKIERTTAELEVGQQLDKLDCRLACIERRLDLIDEPTNS
jgi:hypothetical protein